MLLLLVLILLLVGVLRLSMPLCRMWMSSQPPNWMRRRVLVLMVAGLVVTVGRCWLTACCRMWTSYQGQRTHRGVRGGRLCRQTTAPLQQQQRVVVVVLLLQRVMPCAPWGSQAAILGQLLHHQAAFSSSSTLALQQQPDSRVGSCPCSLHSCTPRAPAAATRTQPKVQGRILSRLPVKCLRLLETALLLMPLNITPVSTWRLLRHRRRRRRVTSLLLLLLLLGGQTSPRKCCYQGK